MEKKNIELYINITKDIRENLVIISNIEKMMI